MIELLAILLATYAIVGLACYEAGRDEGARLKWELESRQALDLVAQSRGRHPSGR